MPPTTEGAVRAREGRFSRDPADALRPSAPRHRSILLDHPPATERPPARGLLEHAAWAGAVAVLLAGFLLAVSLPSPHFALIPAGFLAAWAHLRAFGLRVAAQACGCAGAVLAFLYYDVPYIPV